MRRLITGNRRSVERSGLLAPNGGGTYHVGDSLVVEFRKDKQVPMNVNVVVSVDNGATWSQVSEMGICLSSDDGAGHYTWIISESLVRDDGTSVSALSTACRVKVYDYENEPSIFDISDKAFTIAAK